MRQLAVRRSLEIPIQWLPQIITTEMVKRVADIRALRSPLGHDARVRKESRCKFGGERERLRRKKTFLGQVKNNWNEQRLVGRRIATRTINPQF